MRKIQSRKAMAMIELIFAIVIMGIVMLSAPLLISTATKSAYVTISQESVTAVSSEIGMILTHHWDQGDTDPDLSSPILVTAGDTDLNEILYPDGNGTGVRGGTDVNSKRNFLLSTGGRITTTPVANLGSDAGDKNDIDDFDSLSSSLYDVEATTTHEGDVLDTNISLATSVQYISDTPTAGSYAGAGSSLTLPFSTAESATTTNIKMVEVILTTTSAEVELQKTITLKAFACNIGTYALEEETY